LPDDHPDLARVLTSVREEGGFVPGAEPYQVIVSYACDPGADDVEAFMARLADARDRDLPTCGDRFFETS
jgi:hypothetical protein